MNKRSKIDPRVPRYNKLLTATLIALKKLGGSGKNDEILNQVISDLKIPDEVADIPHLGNSNLSELAYQLAWARTYLAKFGVIENSARSVWSIKPGLCRSRDSERKRDRIYSQLNCKFRFVSLILSHTRYISQLAYHSGGAADHEL